MKIIFNCHTEYDLKNQFGLAKKISSGKQTFAHLPLLLKLFNSLDIPITFSLAVGGPVDNYLLDYIQKKKIKFPQQSEIAIHYHSEKFQNGQWQFFGFLEQTEYSDYFLKFENIFGLKPKSLVFGRWKIDESSMELLSRLGIKRDGSFIDSKKIITKPFLINNILEIPVNSFKGQPINPLTRLSHFFLLRKIIKKYHQENFICHIGFHSYDFFRFDKKPEMRQIKKIIFKDILNLIDRYNLSIINLSDVWPADFEELEKEKMPLFGQIFEFLGH